jgi:hypothetical protein
MQFSKFFCKIPYGHKGLAIVNFFSSVAMGGSRARGCAGGVQGVRTPFPPAESALFVEECNFQCLSPVARNT